MQACGGRRPIHTSPPDMMQSNSRARRNARRHCKKNSKSPSTRRRRSWAWCRGLHGVLMQRRASLYGIVNGIDAGVWRPATDSHIAARYDAIKFEGKAQCKAALQKELKVTVDPKAPLLGV